MGHVQPDADDRGQVRMTLRQFICILRSPDAQHGQKPKRADPSQNQRRSRQPRPCADPPSERIGHQPICMRECDLRRKDSTPVNGLLPVSWTRR